MNTTQEGEKMDANENNENRIVCLCKSVSYARIRDAVLNGADEIEKVRGVTTANTGCATHCTGEVERILERYVKQAKK